jgi:hypothetical protein
LEPDYGPMRSTFSSSGESHANHRFLPVLFSGWLGAQPVR